jgi:6-phosphogluconolactonase
LFAEPPLAWPRFDLTLLGMGDDGHTASLFPNSPVDVDSPTVAVTANYQGRPAKRVALTQKVLNSSRNVLFMVAGKSKAVTLSRVLSDKYIPAELPAQRIAPQDGTLIWLIDAEAGSLL